MVASKGYNLQNKSVNRRSRVKWNMTTYMFFYYNKHICLGKKYLEDINCITAPYVNPELRRIKKTNIFFYYNFKRICLGRKTGDITCITDP